MERVKLEALPHCGIFAGSGFPREDGLWRFEAKGMMLPRERPRDAGWSV